MSLDKMSRSLIVLFGLYCFALQSSTQSQYLSGQLSGDLETATLSQVHSLNQLAIKLGELAQVKGVDRKVRSYGNRLVKDHKFADQEILNFSNSHKIQLTHPYEIMGEYFEDQKRNIQNLQSLRGPQFDKEFLSLMEKIHIQMIRMVNAAHGQLQPSKLRNLLGKLLPILNQHEQLALHLEQAVLG
jgi:putative membrane protein